MRTILYVDCDDFCVTCPHCDKVQDEVTILRVLVTTTVCTNVDCMQEFELPIDFNAEG